MDVHPLMIEFPTSPLVVLVEPPRAVLRCYTNVGTIFALTASGREIPLSP